MSKIRYCNEVDCEGISICSCMDWQKNRQTQIDCMVEVIEKKAAESSLREQMNALYDAGYGPGHYFR